MKAEDVKLSPVLSILSKGISGTGKSIASGGKEFRPTYFFDLEDRMRSVINYYMKLDGHVKDIEFDTFSMGSGFYAIDKKMDYILENYKNYKTVVVSTLSSYVDIVLLHLINAKRGVKRASGQEAGMRIAGISVNELEDFNAEDAAIIFELIGFLKDLQKRGVNVILEAHVTEYDQKWSDSVRLVRSIVTKGRKAAPRIPGYFDECWHFENKNDFGKMQYWLHTSPTALDYAKTSNSIPDIDWTGKDLSVEVMKYISDEVKGNPRMQPGVQIPTKF